ncbi:hypothetical protein DV515_00010519, partial [Chloebia gouldiae]
ATEVSGEISFTFLELLIKTLKVQIGTSPQESPHSCKESPLSPIQRELERCSAGEAVPAAIQSRALEALALCPCSGRSKEGGCLVSEHHHNQAWRRRSPVQHPWRKRNTTASLEGGEPCAASLEVTTFAKACSPPHCTQDLTATSVLRQGFCCPAERTRLFSHPS